MGAPVPEIWSGGHVPIIGDDSLTVSGGDSINFNVGLSWDSNPSTLGYSVFKMELSAAPIGLNDPPTMHDIYGINRADTLKTLTYDPLNQQHLPMDVVIGTTNPSATTTIYRRLLGYRSNKLTGKWLYSNHITLARVVNPPITNEDRVFKVFFDEVTPPEKIVVYLRIGRLRAAKGSLTLATSNNPAGASDPPGPTAGVAEEDWKQSVTAWQRSTWTRVVVHTAPTNSAVPVYFTLRWKNGQKTREITSNFAVTVKPK